MDHAGKAGAVLLFNGDAVAIIANGDDGVLQHIAEFTHERAQAILQALVGTANIET